MITGLGLSMASNSIPHVFDQPGAAFVLLPVGIKFPPIEDGWQKPEKAHTFHEATAHRGNVGILAGNGYIGLDQDEPAAFTGLELPNSTTWETRPGRLGMWFKVSDNIAEALAGIGKKAEQAQLKLHKDGLPVGEVKLQRTYQVIPWSWKKLDDGSRVDYKMVDSSPPAAIALADLLQGLQSIGITFSSKLEQNAAKLESNAREARKKRAETDESKARRYAAAALKDEVLILAGTPEGSRNQQLNDSAFALGQLEAKGLLDEDKVISELTRAAENTGLDSEEIARTIRSGLDAGRQHPRKIPEREEPATETVKDCSLIELGTVFTKWLYIQEGYNLTSFFSGVIANFCDGSPDILGIIGPSGSTKTELIRSLGETQNQYVYPVSTITQHTLVSGHKDSRDLVPQLNGRILAIKDLTSILSSKEEVRSMIFADFRELTDEYIRKEFGNGIAKEYRDIHSSILFASTTAIERYYSMYSNLGQRMIFFRPQNDPKKARERARQNRDRQKEMRQELHDVTMRFIASMLKVKDTKGLPTTPDHIAEEMGELFDFLAIARTPIHHDYRTGDIDELPEPEFPTRISNTIGRLMEVHALIHGREEVNAEDMAFGCRIISDNIPSMRWKILRALTTDWQHTAKIAQVEDLTIGAVKYHIDELVALKLVQKLLKDEVNSSMDRRFDYYKLSEMSADAIEKYKTRVRAEGNSQDELNKLIEIKNISLSNPCLVSPGNEPEQPPSKPVLDGDGEPVSPPTIGPNPKAEDPGLAEFKKKIKARSDRRTCASCGQHFVNPLVVHGRGGYICESCRRSGPPTATTAAEGGDHQSQLGGEAAP